MAHIKTILEYATIAMLIMFLPIAICIVGILNILEAFRKKK